MRLRQHRRLSLWVAAWSHPSSQTGMITAGCLQVLCPQCQASQWLFFFLQISLWCRSGSFLSFLLLGGRSFALLYYQSRFCSDGCQGMPPQAATGGDGMPPQAALPRKVPRKPRSLVLEAQSLVAKARNPIQRARSPVMSTGAPDRESAPGATWARNRSK